MVKLSLLGLFTNSWMENPIQFSPEIKKIFIFIDTQIDRVMILRLALPNALLPAVKIPAIIEPWMIILTNAPAAGRRSTPR